MFLAFKTKVDSSQNTGLSDEFFIGSNDVDVKAKFMEWVGLDETYCAGYAKVINYHSMLDGSITTYESPLSDVPLGAFFVLGKNHSSGFAEYNIFLNYDNYDSDADEDSAIGLFNEKVAEGVNNGEQIFVAYILEGTDWAVDKASTYREGKSFNCF